MIHHLSGKLTQKTPAHIVVECNGVGYLCNVSVNTFTRLKDKSEALVFTHLVVREDAQLLYGFADPEEREVFKMLISVSGVGAATAQMILSSLTSGEVGAAIQSEDVATLKKIKGIGAKSAQRIIVDLKDKMSADIEISENLAGSGNTNKEEALSALTSLGFDKRKAGKVLDQIIHASENEVAVELLIKEALKKL